MNAIIRQSVVYEIWRTHPTCHGARDIEPGLGIDAAIEDPSTAHGLAACLAGGEAIAVPAYIILSDFGTLVVPIFSLNIECGPRLTQSRAEQ